MRTSTFQHKCLLVDTAVAKLEVYVGQPWLDTSRLPDYVLFINAVLFRLGSSVTCRPKGQKARGLTMR